MEVLIYLCLTIYVLVYLPSWYGNWKLSKKGNSLIHVNRDSIDCTVVIPIHNESENMNSLLDSLAILDPAPTEIILVDDYSTDDGMRVAEAENLPNLKIVTNTGKRGKKNALTVAIQVAKNELIVTSDADCFFHPLWLDRLVGQHEQQGNKFTFGMVEYSHNSKWIEYYQWMESRALMAVGVGMFSLNYPIMCNGANLVFNKSTWEQVGGYSETEKVQGGDDIFLMHKIWQNNPKDVGLCLEPEALVITKAHTSFKAFMKQRKRWVMKTGKYKVQVANLFPLFVGIANLLILATLIYSLYLGSVYSAVLLLIGKAVVDYAIISGLKQGFLNCVSFPMLMQFQLFQLVYPFFIPFFKSDWKSEPTENAET